MSNNVRGAVKKIVFSSDMSAKGGGVEKNAWNFSFKKTSIPIYEEVKNIYFCPYVR